MSKSTVVVEVSGSLDETDRSYFFDCVGDIIDSGYENVVIECHRLGHIRSSGLAALLGARKRAAKRGSRIYLTHLNSRLARVLERTKLGRLLLVYPETEDAIACVERELVPAS